MLVLSRKASESVVFPELQITVEVLEIKGDRVRLGFKAPATVTILRGELVVQLDPARMVATTSGVAAQELPTEKLPTEKPPAETRGSRVQQRIARLAKIAG